MNSRIFSIPNVFTLCNLFAGCLAIVSISKTNYELSLAFISASLVFDYLDGFTARLLNTDNVYGKELDSLSDIVSFGVVPGFIFYKLLVKAWPQTNTVWEYLPAIAFLITVFAALRLANYNIEEDSKDQFMGLPTPGVTLYAAGIWAIHWSERCAWCIQLTGHPVFILLSVVCLSLLMISRIPLFNLRFSNLKWQSNEIRWTFLAISLLTLILFSENAPTLLVVIYILLSLFQNWIIKSRI